MRLINFIIGSASFLAWSIAAGPHNVVNGMIPSSSSIETEHGILTIYRRADDGDENSNHDREHSDNNLVKFDEDSKSPNNSTLSALGTTTVPYCDETLFDCFNSPEIGVTWMLASGLIKMLSSPSIKNKRIGRNDRSVCVRSSYGVRYGACTSWNVDLMGATWGDLVPGIQNIYKACAGNGQALGNQPLTLIGPANLCTMQCIDTVAGRCPFVQVTLLPPL